MTQDPAALEADIARTREELAHTVDELTARLDVKARTKQRLAHTKDQAAGQVRRIRDQAVQDNRPTPAALAVGGALVAVVVIGIVWRRRS